MRLTGWGDRETDGWSFSCVHRGEEREREEDVARRVVGPASMEDERRGRF